MTGRVWVVVQVKTADGRTFEIGGIYTTEEQALAACTEPTDAMFGIQLDTDLGRETTLVGVYPAEHAAAIRAMGTTGRRAELTEHGVEHLDLKSAREQLSSIDDEDVLTELWRTVTDRLNTVKGHNG